MVCLLLLVLIVALPLAFFFLFSLLLLSNEAFFREAHLSTERKPITDAAFRIAISLAAPFSRVLAMLFSFLHFRSAILPFFFSRRTDRSRLLALQKIVECSATSKK